MKDTMIGGPGKEHLPAARRFHDGTGEVPQESQTTVTPAHEVRVKFKQPGPRQSRTRPKCHATAPGPARPSAQSPGRAAIQVHQPSAQPNRWTHEIVPA